MPPQADKKKTTFFCEYLRSALAYNIKPEVLKWGQPWKGNTEKITSVHTALQGVKDDTVIIFSDAGDVLLNQPSDAFASKFLKTGKQFIMGTEPLCGGWNCHRHREKEYPHSSGTGGKYVNSGCWVAKAGYARQLLGHMITDYGLADGHGKSGIMPSNIHTDSDQAWYGLAFLDGLNGKFPMKFDLDYNEDFCHNLQEPYVLHNTVQIGNSGVLENKDKQKWSMVHFNGPEVKVSIPEFERNLWYMKDTAERGKLASLEVSLNGKSTALKEVCP